MVWPFSSSSHHRSSHYSVRPSYSRASSIFSSHSHHSRGHSSSSSYYKRRPRSGYVSRLIYKLRHLLRELLHYARRHPVKVFIFVIMPLISGGVLAGVAKTFGIRLPAFLMGGGHAAGSGMGYYGSAGYGGSSGGLSSLAGSAGGMDGIMKMAKMFL